MDTTQTKEGFGWIEAPRMSETVEIPEGGIAVYIVAKTGEILQGHGRSNPDYEFRAIPIDCSASDRARLEAKYRALGAGRPSGVELSGLAGATVYAIPRKQIAALERQRAARQSERAAKAAEAPEGTRVIENRVRKAKFTTPEEK